MINQKLIDECEKDLDSFGSLMKCQAVDLIDAYTSLIEQNAELHKELARLRKINQDMHTAVGGYLHGNEWIHWEEFKQKSFGL